MYDDIIHSLNLKAENVESISHAFKNNTHFYFIKLVSRGVFCPDCGQYTKKVHEYKNISLNHSIFITENASVIYKARRYICPHCSRTTFENNPFKSHHPRLTLKTVQNVLILLKDYNQTFSMVAKKTNLSVTEVITIFDEHVQIERKKLSEAICIDEFFFSRHAKNKYACMLINFKNGLVLDILPSRHKADLRSYFRMIPLEERMNVKYITMDLYDNYRDIAYHWLPNAVVCADSFHIIKNINDILNKLRISKMHDYEDNKKSDEYYLLKHMNYLLFKDSLDISDTAYKKNRHFSMRYTDGQLLEKILAIDTQLKEGYELKELYMIFIQQDDLDIIESFLELIINNYKLSTIVGFQKLGNTLESWKKEIINSFIKYDNRKLSNGPIEGRNKYIHIILELANGYSNFKRFRNRAMYILNRLETYNEKILDVFSVRGKGKERGKYNTKKANKK